MVAVSTLHDSFHTTPTGFVVVRDGQRRVFRDGDVVGVRTSLDYSMSSWSESTVRQSLDLQVENAHSEWLTVATDLQIDPLESDDPLMAFRRRVVHDLVDRAWECIAGGGEWTDHEWSLSLNALEQNQTGKEIRPQEIARFGWQGDEFCVWHEDRQSRLDPPVLKFDRESPNTLLLEGLLERFTPRKHRNEDELSTFGLGKLINQLCLHDEHETTRWAIVGVSSVLLLLSLNTISPGILGIGVLGLLMCTLVLMPRIRGRREFLDHYERGFVWHRGRHQQLVHFDHLESFSAIWPADTTTCLDRRVKVWFRFVTTDPKSLPLDIVVPLNRNRERLENAQSLQAHLTSILANRLQDRLARQGRAAWTKRLAIVRDGLEFVTPEGGRQFARFNQLDKCQFVGTQLRLASTSLETEWLQPADELNFYPGYLLAKLSGLVAVN